MRFEVQFGNIFNRTTFCDPNTNWSSGAFGLVSTQCQPGAIDSAGLAVRLLSRQRPCRTWGARPPRPALPGVTWEGRVVSWRDSGRAGSGVFLVVAPAGCAAAAAGAARSRSRSKPSRAQPPWCRRAARGGRPAGAVGPLRSGDASGGLLGPGRHPPSAGAARGRRPASPGGHPAGAPPPGGPAEPRRRSTSCRESRQRALEVFRRVLELDPTERDRQDGPGPRRDREGQLPRARWSWPGPLSPPSRSPPTGSSSWPRTT